MMFFQNALARLKDDDNPRLHRVPFAIIWVASYALAWFVLFFASMIVQDMNNASVIGDFLRWINRHAQWINGIGMGFTFGLTLSLIQTWLIRRRYGFVPKFWRLATILGATLIGLIYPFFGSYYFYWEYEHMWFVLVIWFALLNVLQAFVIFPVNRQAWLFALVGIIAGVVAGGIELIEIDRYTGESLSILWGGLIQAVGTSIVMLRLMASPRKGIVPKRENDEKSKSRLRDGLHPITFIGLWTLAYISGWVMVLLVTGFLYMLFGETNFGYVITDWLETNALWTFGAFYGLVIGLTSSIAQLWLMKQYSNVEVKNWVVLSTIGWAIAGIGFWYYVESYNVINVEIAILLFIWGFTPTLFQTIPMWRVMRGGWIWAGTGIASAIIAFLIDAQSTWTYNDTFYAIMLGGLAQAIITGSTFILLQSQQNRVEHTSVSA